MTDQDARSTPASVQDDSFDELLRRAAHVSEPARPGPQFHPGQLLVGSRLRIIRAIGEGGMGRVYEAHDTQRRGPVALKTLTSMDAAGLYQLKNEFRSLADVSHRNEVRLYDLFGEDERWFFTMELVDGRRFDEWVRPHSPGSQQAALQEARLRDALLQLCTGIAAIHAAGKLHRDLLGDFFRLAPADFKTLLLAQTDPIQARYPARFARFFVEGVQHVALSQPKDSASVGAVTARQWAKAFIDGTPDWVDTLEDGGQ